MVNFIRDMPRWAVFIVAVLAIAANFVANRLFADLDEIVETVALVIILVVFAVRAFGRRRTGVRLSKPYPRTTRDLD